MEQTINIKLKIWRQRGPKEPGQFVDYSLDNVPTNISFLEMLDMLNEQLVEKGEEPVVFDNDCARESAVCAHSTSTVILTDLLAASLLASCTCVSLTTATLSLSSMALARIPRNP